MEKHTPGPWHLGESKTGRQYIYARDQQFPLKPEVKLNKTFTQEQKANALIMAAAPDLLLALSELTRLLGLSLPDDKVEKARLDMFIQRAVDQAQAAITKALHSTPPASTVAQPDSASTHESQ